VRDLSQHVGEGLQAAHVVGVQLDRAAGERDPLGLAAKQALDPGHAEQPADAVRVRSQQPLGRGFRLLEASPGDQSAAKQRESVLVVRLLCQCLGQQRVGLVIPVKVRQHPRPREDLLNGHGPSLQKTSRQAS
jgi:hypothetical protein